MADHEPVQPCLDIHALSARLSIRCLLPASLRLLRCTERHSNPMTVLPRHVDLPVGRLRRRLDVLPTDVGDAGAAGGWLALE
jgi:hypothetical protein